MPTLPIEFSPAGYTLMFTVILEDGTIYEAEIKLEIPGQAIRPGPDATVTFDSEADLAGEHACTCTLTESGSKITAANGVVIDNKFPEDTIDEFGFGSGSVEVSGSINWDT